MVLLPFLQVHTLMQLPCNLFLVHISTHTHTHTYWYTHTCTSVYTHNGNTHTHTNAHTHTENLTLDYTHSLQPSFYSRWLLDVCIFLDPPLLEKDQQLLKALYLFETGDLGANFCWGRKRVSQGWQKHFSFGQAKYCAGIIHLYRCCEVINALKYFGIYDL